MMSLEKRLEGLPGALVVLGCLALLGFMVEVKAEGAVIAAVAAVTTLLGYLAKSPEKKDPPGAAVVLLGAVFAVALLACGGSP